MFASNKESKVDNSKRSDRQKIYLQVKISNAIKYLFLEVNSLPVKHKDDLLEYFNDDKLDFSQITVFHSDVAKKLRVAQCQCGGINIALCVCFFCVMCILSAKSKNPEPCPPINNFFSDTNLVKQLKEVKSSLENINKDYQELKEIEKFDESIRLTSIV